MKVLLVEDDGVIRSAIGFILSENGFEVMETDCINEARKAADTAALCLIDVMLPDGSGFDLCREIREKNNVPVIFITAVDENKQIAKGLNIGADDYITKPFDGEVLMSRINAVLRRAGYFDNDTLDLTAVEKRLMDYFKINKNRVLTREQILSRLWDSKGEFVNDNTLSVRVNRLRAKLEKDGHSGKILTVKGVGYKWTD
jgi:DNA-binding response OmpR family regulator